MTDVWNRRVLVTSPMYENETRELEKLSPAAIRAAREQLETDTRNLGHSNGMSLVDAYKKTIDLVKRVGRLETQRRSPAPQEDPEFVASFDRKDRIARRG